MPSAIEQALITIIPAHNVLPPELVNLGTALLSQSNAKASSLKPEEEVARAYVCAQLACERLKTRLGLEKLQSRPPVRPQIYKKLYGYLENLLQTPSTPSARRQTDRLARSAQTTPRSTCRGKAPSADQKTPTSAARSGRASAAATPTSKVLTQADTPSRRASTRKRDAVDQLGRESEDHRQLKRSRRGSDDPDPDQLSTEVSRDALSPKYPPSSFDHSTARSKQTPLGRREKHAPRPDDDADCPAGLRPGLGTMFQDALDWLGQDRTAEYEDWSENILRMLDTSDRRTPRKARVSAR